MLVVANILYSKFAGWQGDIFITDARPKDNPDNIKGAGESTSHLSQTYYKKIYKIAFNAPEQ